MHDVCLELSPPPPPAPRSLPLSFQSIRHYTSDLETTISLILPLKFQGNVKIKQNESERTSPSCLYLPLVIAPPVTAFGRLKPNT